MGSINLNVHFAKTLPTNSAGGNMRNAALAVLFLSALSFGQLLKSPIIVAQKELLHQTQAVPSTTLFVPNRDMSLRVSAYAVNEVTVSTSPGYWNTYFDWQDGAASEEIGFSTYVGIIASSQATFVLRAKGGTPVQFRVDSVPNTDGSTFDLYLTVEEISPL
jgi:hypothetical protein